MNISLRQHRTEIARQISSIIFCQIDKIDAGILTYFKKILAKMTKNLPKDGVQSRQAALCVEEKMEYQTSAEIFVINLPKVIDTILSGYTKFHKTVYFYLTLVYNGVITKFI